MDVTVGIGGSWQTLIYILFCCCFYFLDVFAIGVNVWDINRFSVSRKRDFHSVYKLRYSCVCACVSLSLPCKF